MYIPRLTAVLELMRAKPVKNCENIFSYYPEEGCTLCYVVGVLTLSTLISSDFKTFFFCFDTLCVFVVNDRWNGHFV